MTSAWLFARAHGAVLIAAVGGVIALAVFATRGQAVASPGLPEGTLIQVWLPMGVSVLATRACYDALGVLAASRERAVLILTCCWLTAVGLCLLLLAFPVAPSHQRYLPVVHPALPVAMVTATAFVASVVWRFTTVATVTLGEGLLLYFLARPALQRDSSGVAALWNGAHGHDGLFAAVLIVLAAIIHGWTRYAGRMPA